MTVNHSQHHMPALFCTSILPWNSGSYRGVVGDGSSSLVTATR